MLEQIVYRGVDVMIWFGADGIERPATLLEEHLPIRTHSSFSNLEKEVTGREDCFEFTVPRAK